MVARQDPARSMGAQPGSFWGCGGQASTPALRSWTCGWQPKTACLCGGPPSQDGPAPVSMAWCSLAWCSQQGCKVQGSGCMAAEHGGTGSERVFRDEADMSQGLPECTPPGWYVHAGGAQPGRACAGEHGAADEAARCTVARHGGTGSLGTSRNVVSRSQGPESKTLDL